MDHVRSKLPVTFTVNDYVDAKDSRFLAITIDVLHTGQNFNGSIFTKEVVDANADSIMNTPVLGYIAANPDGELDFQAHEYDIVEDENGEKYVYSGSAYGVIPESCNYRWIEKECSDGIVREFFQVDGLLWTKFDDAITIFERDGGKPQSMELKLSSITGEESETDGTFTFTGFQFDGCCLLSSTNERIQPAMIDSKAVAFSATNIAQEIKEKLNEYTILMSEKKNSFKEKEAKAGEIVNKEANFTLESLNELRKELSNIVSDYELVPDRWDDDYKWPRYYVEDVNIETNEVIVCDTKDHYRIFGMSFTNDENGVKVDFESKKRKKVVYEDYVEENDSEELFTIENIVNKHTEIAENKISEISTAKETAEANYTQLKSEYDEIKPQYDAYVIEAEKREFEAIEKAKDAEFEKFDAHLADNEDYIQMKENRDQYTLTEIQNQCAILFTEKNLNCNFQRKEKDSFMAANIIESTSDFEEDSRYGFLPTKK